MSEYNANFEGFSRNGLISMCNEYDGLHDGALSDFVAQREEEASPNGKLTFDENGYIIPINYFEGVRPIEKIIDSCDDLKVCTADIKNNVGEFAERISKCVNKAIDAICNESQTATD